MTNPKKWCRFTLILLCFFFVFCIVSVSIIDPFQIYHLAVWYTPPIDRMTQVYSNAGIARNYEYDSAVVGTSVTENFHPSYMDSALGGKFIKLCTSGGTVHNHAILLETAFRTHSMRQIVYGLDIYSLIGESDKVVHPIPEYLYTDTLLDDGAYWFNRSVWAVYIPRCLKTWGTVQTDGLRDSMYNWAGQDEYGPIAMYNAVFTTPQTVFPDDAYTDQARENLEKNILPFIEQHPETEFIFFYPPYSAAEWSNMLSNGTLEALLPLRLLAYDLLSPYANVHFFDFSAREEWVLHIDNYKDTTHYGEWINDAITDCIASGSGLVTNRIQIEAANQLLHSWAETIFSAGKWIFY